MRNQVVVFAAILGFCGSATQVFSQQTDWSAARKLPSGAEITVRRDDAQRTSDGDAALSEPVAAGVLNEPVDFVEERQNLLCLVDDEQRTARQRL